MAGKALIDGSLRISVGTTKQVKRFWKTFSLQEGLSGALINTDQGSTSDHQRPLECQADADSPALMPKHFHHSSCEGAALSGH